VQLHHLSKTPSVLDQYLYEIRDKSIQKDALRFRKNMERIGELMGYELSKSLTYHNKEILTPLSKTKVRILQEPLVICSILRAGITLHHGLLNIFDKSENAFVSAYRKVVDDHGNFEIIADYVATPSLEDKTLILADPMLATGQSILATLESLSEFGKPANIHILSVIGAKAGIDTIAKRLPENSHLWIADIDPVLNSHQYIVPGLGDAGDLAYGNKLNS
jgi:uracil phosphoribosyltransferase